MHLCTKFELSSCVRSTDIKGVRNNDPVPLNLLNPKSTGLDRVLRTTAVPGFNSFRSGIFVLSTYHNIPTNKQTNPHHAKAIAICAPPHYVGANNDGPHDAWSQHPNMKIDQKGNILIRNGHGLFSWVRLPAVSLNTVHVPSMLTENSSKCVRDLNKKVSRNEQRHGNRKTGGFSSRVTR